MRHWPVDRNCSAHVALLTGEPRAVCLPMNPSPRTPAIQIVHYLPIDTLLNCPMCNAARCDCTQWSFATVGVRFV